MADPLVSIVIPTYNRWELTERAVASCLRDTQVGSLDIEVVVVDDGSTDEIAGGGALGHRSVRVIPQRNSGVQAARNRGLEVARGRFVRFLDSDDWVLPGATAAQIVALDEAGAEVAYGDSLDAFEGRDGMGPSGQSIGEAPDMLAALLGGRWVPPFCYLYRREALDGVRWREDIPAACEDFDFILDVAFSGASMVYVPGVVGCYFHHTGERVSRRSSETWSRMMLNALQRASSSIDSEQAWTEERREAVARSALALASGLVGVDEDLFLQAIGLVEAVCPGYRPDQRGRRLIARLLGLRRTERLLLARRRLLAVSGGSAANRDALG